MYQKAGPQKAHLLIVDDEANTLASLARAFRLAGHEATVCDNAAKALELARSPDFRPDPLGRRHAGQGRPLAARRPEVPGSHDARGHDVGSGAYRHGGARHPAGRARFSGETDLHRKAAAHRRERAQAAAAGIGEPAAAAAPGQTRNRVDRRNHEKADGPDRARGRQRNPGLHSGRNRHRQGTGRAHPARAQPASRQVRSSL